MRVPEAAEKSPSTATSAASPPRPRVTSRPACDMSPQTHTAAFAKSAGAGVQWDVGSGTLGCSGGKYPSAWPLERTMPLPEPAPSAVPSPSTRSEQPETSAAAATANANEGATRPSEESIFMMGRPWRGVRGGGV
jgi:hypothetical protein